LIWQFIEGRPEAGIPHPQIWKTSLEWTNTDSRAWTVVPDMLFSEVLDTESLDGGICAPEKAPLRNACLWPCRIGAAPLDLSGSASRDLTFLGAGPSPGTFTPRVGTAQAHWRLHQQEQLWQATLVPRGDQLSCVWEHWTADVFKPELRTRPGYHLVQYGPVFFDNDNPRGNAYVLVARSTPGGKINEWQSEAPRFLPLTAEEVRRQIDADLPLSARMQFVVWLWDQPRPVDQADRVLLELVKEEAKYPVNLRAGAARGLLELRSLTALPTLLDLLSNKGSESRLRSAIIDGLPLLPDKGVEPLSAVALDAAEKPELRTAALRSLAKTETKGWVIIEKLKNDAQMGKEAESLLQRRDNFKP
jgi:hypothetical protein